MSLNILAALTAINDASIVINALSPLVQRAINFGRDITDAELKEAQDKTQMGIDKAEATLQNMKDQDGSADTAIRRLIPKGEAEDKDTNKDQK